VKALVKEKAGPGFVLKNVPEPTIRDDEVLIRVRRAGVCGTDVHIYDWDPWAQGRVKPPIVVGHEFAGEVARVGPQVTDVRVGGRVQMLGIPAKPMDIDFATEIIFKGLTIYGVVGRRMYDTWLLMTRFLRSGQFDPTPVITHRFPLEGFDDAIRAIKSGEAGKVIFEIA
jgi:threonine dehydrogenase-like Zn-dependent dehydrogenase